MITVLSILGTRPEAVKMAPVIAELEQHRGSLRSIVCSTGQHGRLLDEVLELFAIRPDIDLQVMRPGQSLAGLTARLLESLEPVVERIRPHWIVAQGDTTTVLAASLVAYYRQIRFAHVEAGLRTGDLGRPFPEEFNRRAADLLASALFAPTERARDVLVGEGCPPERVFISGNTVVDALHRVLAMPFDPDGSPLAGLPLEKRLILFTAHRRESFGRPFEDLCRGVRELAERFLEEDVHIVYPVHPNPQVQGPAARLLGNIPNVSLIKPLDYLSLIHLLSRCELVLTDSGGLQEEAPGVGVPVLVLRDTTERPEGIEAGVARLVGTDPQRIVAEAARLLSDSDLRRRMTVGRNPYGDGFAAQRIVAHLLSGAAMVKGRAA